MNRIALVCFCLLLSFCLPLYAQQTVSGLTAREEGGSILLTWIQPASPVHTYLILRSGAPFSAQDAETLPVLASIPGTETEYTDTPDSPGEFYYAVLVQDEDGTVHRTLIPSLNATITGILSAESEQILPEPADISRLTAIVQEETVILTWNSTPRGRQLVMYRSTVPFTDMASLSSAIIVGTLTDSEGPYIDYPIPEISYYYALEDEQRIMTGEITFTPEENTTSQPVSVAAGTIPSAPRKMLSVRPVPLPYLNILPRRETADIFSPDVISMLDSLSGSSGKTAPPVLPKPYIFPGDTTPESGGERYALSEIIRGSFSGGKWETAASELNRFLSIRRTPEITARANFYLGETYYFMEQYEQALFKFLLARDSYYSQSRIWIQHTLTSMTE
jgi:hypothetical protein